MILFILEEGYELLFTAITDINLGRATGKSYFIIKALPLATLKKYEWLNIKKKILLILVVFIIK